MIRSIPHGSRESLKESNDRGMLWPLLFTILGVVNVFDFFYKSAHQPDDLLQGIGFLLVAPLAYFSPAAFSFGTRTEKPRASVWLNGMAITGLALVITGFAFKWGWL